MSVQQVSLDRPQQRLPLIHLPPNSLEKKVKSVALAILAVVAIGTASYLISSSWPITLLAAGFTLLILCTWSYYTNRKGAIQLPPPIPKAPALIHTPPAIPTSSQTASPTKVLPSSLAPSVCYKWQESLKMLMHTAKRGCTQTHIEECQEILKKNKEHLNDPINGNWSFGTIAHQLAKMGPAQFVSIFQKYGVDFTILDQLYKNTPLHWAIANACNETALEIIRHTPSAALNIQCVKGNTPLHLAIAKGYTDFSYHGQNVGCPNFALTKALIKRGAKIDIPNYATKANPRAGGNTAFHIACARRDVDTLQLLMTKNPSLTLCNNNSKSGPNLIDLSYSDARALLQDVVGEVFLLDETTHQKSLKASHAIVSLSH